MKVYRKIKLFTVQLAWHGTSEEALNLCYEYNTYALPRIVFHLYCWLGLGGTNFSNSIITMGSEMAEWNFGSGSFGQIVGFSKMSILPFQRYSIVRVTYSIMKIRHENRPSEQNQADLHQLLFDISSHVISITSDPDCCTGVCWMRPNRPYKFMSLLQNICHNKYNWIEKLQHFQLNCFKAMLYLIFWPISRNMLVYIILIMEKIKIPDCKYAYVAFLSFPLFFHSLSGDVAGFQQNGHWTNINSHYKW